MGSLDLTDRRHANKRAGVATLELVLALPVVLALVVALVWLGFSIIGQAEVTVAARDEAWKERFKPWSGRPYDFNDDGMGSADESREIRITPVLDQESGPESSHTVEQANWDHRSVEFESVLNFDRMTEMLVAAKTVGLVAQVTDLREAFSELRDLGPLALAEALRDIAAELTNPGGQLKAGADQGKQRAELDRDLAKSRAEGALQDLKSERERLKSERNRMKDDESSEDAAWLIDRKIERVEILIELAKDRLREF